MINANELRLSNYVNYQGKALRVHLLFSISNNSMWEPIPLSNEWMSKFGIKKFVMSQVEIKKKTESYYQSTIVVNGRKFTFKLYYLIKYVHEFQNVFFSLTGKELQAG
jgi:hypothetical protein